MVSNKNQSVKGALRLTGLLAVLGASSQGMAAGKSQNSAFTYTPSQSEVLQANGKPKNSALAANKKKTLSAVDLTNSKIKIANYQGDGSWLPLEQQISSSADPKSSYLSALQELAGVNANIPPSLQLLNNAAILKLAGIAPDGLGHKEILSLASLVRDTLASGIPASDLLNQLKKPHAFFGTSSYQKKKLTAYLLYASGLGKESRGYLPELSEAMLRKDTEVVFQHLLQMTEGTPSAEMRARSWKLAQWLLEQDYSSKIMLSHIHAQTFGLVVDLDKATRLEWLKGLVNSDSNKLTELLDSLYSKCLSDVAQKDMSALHGDLLTWKVLFETAEQIPNFSSELYAPWTKKVEDFSLLWVHEVYRYLRRQEEIQKLSRGKKAEMDFLKVSQLASVAIELPKITKLLHERVSLRVQAATIYVYIADGKFDEALLEIEKYAKFYPTEALTFSEMLLLNWVKTESPVRRQDRRNTMNGIPMTSVRQARNIENLAKMYKRILTFGVGDLRDVTIVNVFADCYSPVEVFERHDIEAVMGKVESLSTSRMSMLALSMEKKLAGAWADEKQQKSYDTGRSPAELKESIEGGYTLLVSLLDEHIKKHDDYRTLLQLARVYSKRAHFEREQEAKKNVLYNDSDYNEKIRKSLQTYELAAISYNKLSQGLTPESYDTAAFTGWFRTLVGSYSLEGGAASDNLEKWGFAAIRKRLDESKDSARHLKLFGDVLMAKIAKGGAEKKSYIDAALMVLGDHPSGDPARKFQAYYKSLVKEIELHAELLDSSRSEAGKRSYGMFISLRHTEKISRESRGFYRFVAPPVAQDRNGYRGLFSNTIKSILGEHFEVKTITYAPAGTRPRALMLDGERKQGWSETPFAYVYFVSKSPSVDRIPAIPIDLKFNDYKGEVTIPFYSNVILLDAEKADKATIPRNLKVFQTLNERTRDANTISLEIRATADGLIPDLGDILALNFSDFQVVSQVDEGVQVNKLVVAKDATEKDFTKCERNWTITLSLPDLSPSKPTKFHFPTPKDKEVEVEYHRYVDADLETVDAVIEFDAKKMESAWGWLWWLSLVPIAGGLGWFLLRRKTSEPATEEETKAYTLPETINGFTSAALLMTLRKDAVITDANLLEELDRDLKAIEKAQFSASPDLDIDYKELCKKWLKIAAKL